MSTWFGVEMKYLEPVSERTLDWLRAHGWCVELKMYDIGYGPTPGVEVRRVGHDIGGLFGFHDSCHESVIHWAKSMMIRPAQEGRARKRERERNGDE